MVTSNKSFGDWGEVFNNQSLTTAILDRLLHHATTVNIKGDGYRLREKPAGAANPTRVPGARSDRLLFPIDYEARRR
jgi:hypothetical protein